MERSHEERDPTSVLIALAVMAALLFVFVTTWFADHPRMLAYTCVSSRYGGCISPRLSAKVFTGSKATWSYGPSQVHPPPPPSLAPLTPSGFSPSPPGAAP